MNRSLVLLLVLLALGLVACDPGSSLADAGPPPAIDSGPADAGPADASTGG